MKFLTLVAVLFYTGLSFSQSRKKINEQLRIELASVIIKCDSMSGLALNKAFQIRDKNMDLSAAQLRNEQRQATDLTDALAKVENEYNQLVRLGEEPSRLVNLNDLRKEVLHFQEKLIAMNHSEKNQELQKPVLLRDHVMLIKKNKRKEQTRWLEDELKRYSLAIEENTVRIVRMDEYLKNLEAARNELDSIYLNYENVLYDLAIEESKLLGKIRKLKEFSLENWPKNFSPVFEREFGKPERNEIGQPTDVGLSTHVWYSYPDGDPFGDFIRYANPIPINEFSLERMKSQGGVIRRIEPDLPLIYSDVSEEAGFPGGNVALMQFLRNNFHIPEMAMELGVSGKIRMKFVVLKDGSVTDVKVEKGLTDCPECDREAIRVIKMMPKWNPAKFQGKVVNSWYSLPIQIHVN